MTVKKVFLAAIVLTVLFTSGCTSQTGGITGSDQKTTTTEQNVVNNCRDVQVPYETQEEYAKTEYYTETVPYTDRECEQKTLVYSITDFTLGASVCNEQEEVCHQSYPILGCVDKTLYCVDRTVSCYLKINNLDDERGSWTIKFDFMKSGSSSVEATDTSSNWLYPHSSGTIGGSGKITTKELLDTAYTCRYSVTNEPTKEICRDVIKYKDVQKERQVTAYKPVTKYRTEQKCD
jgi:hypothetical protein